MKIEYKHMLQRLLPALAFLLWGMMAGCSGSEGEFREPTGERLELRAFSETLPGEVSLADTVFFAGGSESGKYADIWKAVVGTGGRIRFSEPKYYPSDDSRIYLCGFAPEGMESYGGEGNNARITWSTDGQQDILVSNEQSGSLTDMFWQEGKSFEFIHLLTQLRFRLCCDAEGEAKGWKLRSLEAEGLQRDAVLSLSGKSLSFSGKKDVLTVLDRTKEGEMLPLATDWTDIAEVIMIQPGVAVCLTITVEDEDGNPVRFEHLPVTFHEEENLSMAGTSYLLSVRLRTEDEVLLSATVAPWKTGAPGSGMITGD